MAGRFPHKGLRSCAGCRTRKTKDKLLFLLKSEQRLAVYVSRPVGAFGRGTYCCLDAGCLERVLKKLCNADSVEEIITSSMEFMTQRVHFIGLTKGPGYEPIVDKLGRATRMMEVVLMAHRKRRSR
ncbi:YlxR family protein [Myxococcota bacterium]|nr:YlxR family protein [Myxococcota bacterium]